MWLRSSTQPISITRSPLAWLGAGGFGIENDFTQHRWNSSSNLGAPSRPAGEACEDGSHLGFGRREAAAGVDQEMRAGALVRVRHLLGQDGMKFLLRHAGPGQDALALDRRQAR